MFFYLYKMWLSGLDKTTTFKMQTAEITFITHLLLLYQLTAMALRVRHQLIKQRKQKRAINKLYSWCVLGLHDQLQK